MSEAGTHEVTTLDQVRGMLLPSPFVRPEDIICAAEELSMADGLERAAQRFIKRLEETGRPLPPKARIRLRLALAALADGP